ncbi:MAG: hypothetical protein ACFCUQ_00010 [Kiloniellales bacterium]
MSDVTLNSTGSYAPSGAQVGKSDGERWAPGRSLRFVVFTSLGLWAIIIGATVSLI